MWKCEYTCVWKIVVIDYYRRLLCVCEREGECVRVYGYECVRRFF